MSRYSNPDAHCPICGRALPKKIEDKTAHVCAKTVWSAIDAANTRAGDDLYELRIADPASRPFSERIARGFAVMQDDDDDPGHPYMSKDWWTRRRKLEARGR